MDKADIPEDKWMAKQHSLPGARDQLTEGFNALLETDVLKKIQHCSCL